MHSEPCTSANSTQQWALGKNSEHVSRQRKCQVCRKPKRRQDEHKRMKFSERENWPSLRKTFLIISSLHHGGSVTIAQRHWREISCPGRVMGEVVEAWTTPSLFTFQPWEIGASVVAQMVKNLPVMQEATCNAGDLGLIPGSRRFPGKGNRHPLQYSCLENPTDRRPVAYCPWVSRSRTRLSNLSMHTTMRDYNSNRDF